jgi:hypothetical protein
MMHYKNKIRAIVIFFLSVSSSIYAYTREDLETWRTQSAYAALAIDAAAAATILGITDGAVKDVLEFTLRNSMDTNTCQINHVLSAALEKDPSWFCLNLLTTVAVCRSYLQQQSQEKQLKKILAPLLPQILTTILCAITTKNLPGKKYTMIRRLLRVLIATTTRTATDVVAEKLVPSRETSRWYTNPAYILCSHLMKAITTETLGAIVAQGIQEDKKQLA